MLPAAAVQAPAIPCPYSRWRWWRVTPGLTFLVVLLLALAGAATPQARAAATGVPVGEVPIIVDAPAQPVHAEPETVDPTPAPVAVAEPATPITPQTPTEAPYARAVVGLSGRLVCASNMPSVVPGGACARPVKRVHRRAWRGAGVRWSWRVSCPTGYAFTEAPGDFRDTLRLGLARDYGVTLGAAICVPAGDAIIYTRAASIIDLPGERETLAIVSEKLGQDSAVNLGAYGTSGVQYATRLREDI